MTTEMKTNINSIPQSFMKAMGLYSLNNDLDIEVIARTAEVLVEWNNTRENDEIGRLIEQLNNRAWELFDAQVTK